MSDWEGRQKYHVCSRNICVTACGKKDLYDMVENVVGVRNVNGGRHDDEKNAL